MTDPEFTKWMNRLRVAFPDVWEWLSGFSDCAETQACWRQTLRPFSLSECLLIIESWITRTRPVPKRYEFGQLAIIVANSIEFDRAKARQVNGADRERFAFAEKSREDIMRNRRAYEPITPMSNAMRQCQKLLTARNSGEITDQEFERRKKEIIDAI